MLENFEQLSTTFDNCISLDKIIINERIGSGISSVVYRGNYNGVDIILKKFDSIHCENESDIISDLTAELNNYKQIQNLNQCCELIGYSFSNFNKSYQTYLLLKDYETDGDLYDFIKNDKHWSHYMGIVSRGEYYYEFRHTEWVYKMDRKLKLEIIVSMCEAIKELHSRNMVHCDIKPNNMIYDQNKNKVILIDFGISRFIREHKVIITEEDMGTMGYMCEELEFGLCSKKSDIYSLGICILEIWTGEIWGNGVNYKECRNEAIRRIRYLEETEKQLGALIRKCILKTVAKRPYIKTVLKSLKNI